MQLVISFLSDYLTEDNFYVKPSIGSPYLV
jgi:hypothetical protein